VGSRKKPTHFVLDTSAWIALLRAADQVLDDGRVLAGHQFAAFQGLDFWSVRTFRAWCRLQG
jgi:hypothetical protein